MIFAQQLSGKLGEAAVMAYMSKVAPLAVRRPSKLAPYQLATPVSRNAQARGAKPAIRQQKDRKRERAPQDRAAAAQSRLIRVASSRLKRRNGSSPATAGAPKPSRWRSSQRIETGQIEYAEMWQQVANTIANLLGSGPT